MDFSLSPYWLGVTTGAGGLALLVLLIRSVRNRRDEACLNRRWELLAFLLKHGRSSVFDLVGGLIGKMPPDQTHLTVKRAVREGYVDYDPGAPPAEEGGMPQCYAASEKGRAYVERVEMSARLKRAIDRIGN